MADLETVYVISDLHLGGGDGSEMTPRRNVAHLAEFVRWMAGQPGRGHLVLNGDIVDFLAERPDAAFDPQGATARLAAIMSEGRTAPFWHALRAARAEGVELTLMLGNHDLELCLPDPRAHLEAALGGGVRFHDDNRALNLGPVLIEHGNRYDDWNLVHHDGLRRVRSALSRREGAPEYDPPAGSRLVVEVMNGIKKTDPFIDLLKPENAAALPLLVAHDPSVLAKAKKLRAYMRQARRAVFDEDTGRPLGSANISAGIVHTDADDDELFALASELAGESANVGFIQDNVLAAVDWMAQAAWPGISRAIAAYAKRRPTFDIDHEDERYLRAVRASAAEGFRVVVYGHTHLPKQIRDADRTAGALYLNTGTWADLLRLPDDESLEEFLRAIKTRAPDRMSTWRTLVPTFARIRLAGDQVKEAGVFLFADASHQPALDTEEMRRRFSPLGTPPTRG